MRIAVLSGKGGTGKTFVSVNLASVEENCFYIDCDVEEPNGKLFLKPQVDNVEKVSVLVPKIDKDKCNGCRKCVEFCKFNALAYIKENVLVFPELCHGCKGCILICPQSAIIEGERYIGTVEHGFSKNCEVSTGTLNTGEASGVPIINKLFCDLPHDKTVIVDCPPGSSCLVMESIKDSDYCVIVAEPTRFGIHNMNMVYKLVKLFNKPHCLVINKDIEDNDLIMEYCKENGINVISSIPYDSQLGLMNSKGLVAVHESSKYHGIFSHILECIKKEVAE